MSDAPDRSLPLDAVERQPRLSDRVAEQIVATIMSQRLQPGDALPPERELGEQFGVSRTVVREAIRALVARGLLHVRVGSRIRVAAVDPSTVRDAISDFVRTHALEGKTIAEAHRALHVAAGATHNELLVVLAEAVANLAEGTPDVLEPRTGADIESG